MYNKKILTALIALLVLQAADFLAWRYLGSMTTINSVASWGVDISVWIIALLVLGALATVLIIGATIVPRWPLPIFLILAAGISNVIDRIAYGGVVDYINIQILPVFNLADALITIASLWLLVLIIKSPETPQS